MAYLGWKSTEGKGSRGWIEEAGDRDWDNGEETDRGSGPLARPFLAERTQWGLWLAVALGAGVALYFSLPSEPAAWIAPVALAACVVLARGSLGDGPRAVLWGAAALAAGTSLAQGWSQSIAAPVLARPLGPVTVEGRVRAVEPLDRGWRVILDSLTVEGLPAAQTPERVRIRLLAEETEGTVPRPGSHLSVPGKLLPPPEPVAPGAFDFARRLWFERIGAVGYALGPIAPLAPTPARWGDHMALALQALRSQVSARLLAAEPGRDGPLLAALLVGERRSVSEPIQEDLRASGLAHLLAISGLHMSMVGGLLFVVVRGALALWPRAALTLPIKKIAAATALLACLGYLGLSGANVPAQRAFIMTGLVLVAILVDRTALSMRTVALAATLVLALAPWSLLGPSFQMSFAAVVALVASYEALWPRLGGWRAERGGGLGPAALAYLAGVIFTTLVASAATLPYAAYHFHRVAPYGLVANLIAVPLMGFWVMPWALVTLALLPLGLEHWGVWMAGWGLEGILASAHWVAGWEGATRSVPAGPAWGPALATLGGLWLCLWKRSWRLLGLAPLALGLSVPWWVAQPDVLISRGGKLIAVRAETGGLMVSDGRKDQFTRSVWEESHGGAAGLFPERGTSPDHRLDCGSGGCLYTVNGRRVALPQNDAAAWRSAWTTDVVIATGQERPQGPALVIDRRALWREGAHALWLDGDGSIRVDTVARQRGQRPWTGSR
ncbi:MAG: ComEC family competence protein [Rhodospirillum sp.]|nr:ComEC family competence protein [Rhodospirillum sp.]MCF8488853.1 ComEC family competence protein [Rhodospirillum sp.]MCF8500656.1 ComEC family competence protein [Rhodospirillum sp.]